MEITTMRTTRSLFERAATAAAAATALLLAACGTNDTGGVQSEASPGTTASASVDADRHNEADVSFAQGMIPHHRQAVVMSDMAETRAASDQVKDLAENIKKAQEPEIATMSAWLKAWGEKIPEGMGDMEDMRGMDHDNGRSPMPGMMDEHQMDGMRNAEGKTFDTMFLTMMIKHHEGAIDIARTEKQEGAYGPAKKLADDIIVAQTAEISQMRMLLNAS
ncbi:DUF305 domain-containing protein [Streptomyces pristinaespiralis]|uniref:DUF305 domain-containing protein n=1 Tax=Streptomyces pristinaespiralis TaxID=38300 RepID=UPI0033F44CBD